MYVKECIKKGRVIYNISFWNKFWTLLLPVFLTILLLFVLFIAFESLYDNPQNDYFWQILIGSSGLFIFIVSLIILYFKIDNISKFSGESRSQNKKNVLQFIKDNKCEINYKSNDYIIVSIKSKFLSYYNFRNLTILFEGNNVYYNCVTFENIAISGLYIKDFKSPFFWLVNKKVEKKLHSFLEDNS